jgi:hypothetical protein
MNNIINKSDSASVSLTNNGTQFVLPKADFLGIPAIVRHLVDTSLPISDRAKVLHGLVPLPVRSKVLAAATARDDVNVTNSQVARISWVLSTLSILYPAVAPDVPTLTGKTLDEANAALSMVINIAPDVAELVLVVKHYLSWVLQTTEELASIGILPPEIPGVLSILGAIRDLNRTYARRVSDAEFRRTASPDAWAKAASAHDLAVSRLHTGLTTVVSLSLSDVPAAYLRRRLPKEGSLLSPDHRRAALTALKRELVPLARAADAASRPFSLKVYFATAG